MSVLDLGWNEGASVESFAIGHHDVASFCTPEGLLRDAHPTASCHE